MTLISLHLFLSLPLTTPSTPHLVLFSTYRFQARSPLHAAHLVQRIALLSCEAATNATCSTEQGLLVIAETDVKLMLAYIVYGFLNSHNTYKTHTTHTRSHTRARDIRIPFISPHPTLLSTPHTSYLNRNRRKDPEPLLPPLFLLHIHHLLIHPMPRFTVRGRHHRGEYI